MRTIPYRNLPNLLLKMRETILAQFRPIISHFGLTEQQWRILRTLDESGEIEQRELSVTCQILGPSLTGVLSRMEEMGLLSRTRMAEDQRRVNVRMSELGGKVVHAMKPLITQQYRHLEKSYGLELMLELFDVIDKFQRLENATIPQVKLPAHKTLDKDLLKLIK